MCFVSEKAQLLHKVAHTEESEVCVCVFSQKSRILADENPFIFVLPKEMVTSHRSDGIKG